MSNPETIESLGLLPHYDLFINGEFTPSTKPEDKCVSKSPVDGTVLSTFADATKEDVDKAVETAWVAFKTWKNTTPQERSKVLNEIADALKKIRKNWQRLNQWIMVNQSGKQWL